MPTGPRPRRDPTDDWDQLRLLVASPEQATYELLRPIVLFGQPTDARARETGVPARTLRRKSARFAAAGMRSLFAVEDEAEDAAPDRRVLPLGIRRAIVALKAEYPPLGPFAIARICRHRFDRPVSYHTVRQVLAAEPAPLPLPSARRFRRYHDEPDPVARRNAVVTLYLDGWRPTAIAGYLATSRQTVHEVLRRWDAEGWPGLADRPLGPRQPTRKVDLRAMAAIRRLQANPELGEFRIHAALAQQGVHLSPRTCGRILALHRALGAPTPAAAQPREPQPMPFAAQRRHQFWSAVWVWDGTVTIEHEAETLAQYPVALEADGHRLREVGEPRLYATGHASPQPFLSPLDEVAWHPAQRLAPYRPRRKRIAGERQAPLPELEHAASGG